MSKFLLMLAIIALAAFNAANANGLSLNSVGTRALGMGGAFVGLADDASAIYWNPSGLAFIKGSYIGVGACDVVPLPKYENSAIKTKADGLVDHYVAPNFMSYFDIAGVENLKAGFGVFVPAGIGAEYDGADLLALSNGKEYKWKSKIAVINISPALAYQFTPQFSLGVAMNIYYGTFDLKRGAVQRLTPTYTIDGQYEENSDGWGYGVTVGGMYKPWENLSIGASLRMKTNVEMHGTATNTLMPKIPGLNAKSKSDFDRDISWPLWASVGIAYKPIKDLTITFDAQYSQWESACDELDTKFDDAKWMAALTPTEANIFKLKWKDAVQIRFGMEYQALENLAIRLGAYREPSPGNDKTYNLLFPENTYYGITGGFTYKWNSLSFDFGMEYLFGDTKNIKQAYETFVVNGKTTQVASNYPGKHTADHFAVCFGLGWHF
jgi:long-chain fatty acid transport protein